MTSTEESRTASLIVLGAGRDTFHDLPHGLIPIKGHHRVLDWLFKTFEHVYEGLDITLVAGSHYTLMAKLYAHHRLLYNPAWGQSGPVSSLALANKGEYGGEVFVSYADVLYRPKVVELLARTEADIVLAVDSQWQERYSSRSAEDRRSAEVFYPRQGEAEARGLAGDTFEYCGLVKLSAHAWQLCCQIMQERQLPEQAGILALLMLAQDRGATLRVVDVLGDWTELNAPQDVARFVLGTKAESLERLQTLITRSTIGTLQRFTYDEYQRSERHQLDEIHKAFAPRSVIVRSSAQSEDCWTHSAAGAYRSMLNVNSLSRQDLKEAIDQVFASYGNTHADDQVLVQEMLVDVTAAGVILTRTPENSAPYFVINYDNQSRRTDGVTSGARAETCVIHHASLSSAAVAPHFHSTIEAVEEIIGLVGHDSLDIEFATTSDHEVHILQVRPIATPNADSRVSDEALTGALRDAQARFLSFQTSQPFLLGKGTMFSNMCDWNPAEIIGVHPNRLALSIYRHIITDETWARQRAEFGYRDVRPHPLLVEFCGQPYIDVRVDFNSFIPASLAEPLQAKLFEYYLEQLRQRPSLHDKVEFDILSTCLSFSFATKAQELLAHGFTGEEVASFRSALHTITRTAFTNIGSYLARMEEFAARYEVIAGSDLPPLDKAYFLLQEVRQQGALQFAHLARCGFIASEFLHGLAQLNILKPERVQDYFASLSTVPTAMQVDAYRVGQGELSWDDFAEKYAHLRPGSYDITSLPYGERLETYLRPLVQSERGPVRRGPHSVFREDEEEAIRRQLELLEFDIPYEEFLNFIKQAIEGREFSKFVFTKHLNLALECIALFAAGYGVSREDISRCDLEALFALRDRSDCGPALQSMIALEAEKAKVYRSIVLPGVITAPEDFFIVTYGQTQPNYIGLKCVQAELSSLHQEDLAAITGRIVFIQNADPGYDMIFGYKIAGMITMHGGANSHMAIRAAELGVPAAIGVGEVLYNQIAKAEFIELDCAAHKISIIR